jgi:type I restriction enzyme S subunit
MSKYKRYERYKDSGIEWIGEIPEHWEITKLKYICSESAVYGLNESAENYVEEGVRFIRTTDIDNKGNLDNSMGGVFLPEEKVKGYILKTGDLLVSRSGSLGTSLYFDEDKYGKCSYAGYLVKFRANSKNCPKFLFYYSKSNIFYIQIQLALVSSTISNFNGNKYANMILPLPSYYEQKAISNFLDQKTAVIDDLIADKEKLIELLQEKRQAIITEAVTKGLNPNVRMKDSGIEWIGEIPEHWSITKMKYLLSPKKYSIKAGPFGSQLKNDDMVSGDVKVYNQKTVLDNDFKSGDYYIENYKYEELRAFEVFSGDLLVTTRGTIGKTAIVPKDAEKGILHPCLIKITLNPDKVLNEYINVVFNNTKIVTNQIMLESNATTIDVIYTDTLKNLVLPIPPLEEQKSIIDFVDAKIGEIDGLISSINNQIQKLKEYRQSLISEAVTGKIDVREFQNKNEVIFRNE